jgi:hypothetical protein
LHVFYYKAVLDLLSPASHPLHERHCRKRLKILALTNMNLGVLVTLNTSHGDSALD